MLEQLQHQVDDHTLLLGGRQSAPKCPFLVRMSGQVGANGRFLGHVPQWSAPRVRRVQFKWHSRAPLCLLLRPLALMVGPLGPI